MEGRRLAVQHLQHAVTLDGDFALARAALASAYTQQLFYEAGNAPADEKAYMQIQQALAIDPDLAEAYLARAQLIWSVRYMFPHERAVSDLCHALSINPNLADAYIELEKIYYHVGLTDKAIDAHTQAHRLDPAQATSSNRDFRALTDAGRLDEVRARVDRGNLGAYARGDALVALGRVEEALAVLVDAGATTTTDPEHDPGALALLGVVFGKLDRRAEAGRTLEAAIPAALNRNSLSHLHHAQFHVGATLALLGRTITRSSGSPAPPTRVTRRTRGSRPTRVWRR
jgi:tetratricopeptide (TPR) repeat protein